MSKKHAKVMLDGTEYDVPAMNIGQIEEITPIIFSSADGLRSKGYDLIRIMMKRATPQPNWEEIGFNVDEVRVAVETVMSMSGLKKAEENPPQAEPLRVVNNG